MWCVINLDILKDTPGDYEAKSQLMQASLELFEPKSGQDAALIAPMATRLDLTDGSVVPLPPPQPFRNISISPDETLLAYNSGQRVADLCALLLKSGSLLLIKSRLEVSHVWHSVLSLCFLAVPGAGSLRAEPNPHCHPRDAYTDTGSTNRGTDSPLDADTGSYAQRRAREIGAGRVYPGWGH